MKRDFLPAFPATIQTFIKERLPAAMGELEFSDGALSKLSDREIIGALYRHARGDWGDCDANESAANHFACRNRLRVISRYRARGDIEFWVITEADRSRTRLLLASEY